jgi:hypothetical protein
MSKLIWEFNYDCSAAFAVVEFFSMDPNTTWWVQGLGDTLATPCPH